jgi:hypothetical protein
MIKAHLRHIPDTDKVRLIMFSQEFKDLVLKALNMTNNKLSIFPNYGVYIHAKEQLSIIQSFIDKDKSPTQSDKDKINIGLMAVKELESADPDYCFILCEVDYRFRKN